MRNIFLAVGLMAVLASCAQAPAQPAQWPYARPIEVANPTEQPLRDFQVRVVLDAAHFDFEHAAPNGADLRFTELSGTLPLSYWVEQFDAAARNAVVWVKVSALPASASKTLTLHYGNATAETLSSGRRTFDLFDDFGRPGLGYFQFGPPTTIMTRTEGWETQSPHTLSVVEMSPDGAPAQSDGYKYWGYYGLANCGGIGRARSNDLVNWHKDATPLLNQDGERWPAVLKIGNTFYMAHDRDHCAISQVVLRTSTDGLNFGGKDDYAVLVAQEAQVRNQNPALFRDPKTGLFYLYWFRGGAEFGVWQIKMRSARTVAGLADIASERTLLEVPFELAAPNMMLYGDTYFLSTEVNENAWKTTIYASASPAGPFELLPDNPVLSDNQACLFQHILRDPARGDVLHGYICKVIGADWVLNHREAVMTNGRSEQRVLDAGVWSVLSGTWGLIDDAADKTNVVLQGNNGLLKTALPGQDSVFEVKARPSAGAAWGVAVRVQDAANYVAAKVQAGQVQLERVVSGTATLIASAPITLSTTPTQSVWQTLSVSAAGNRFVVRLNGVTLIQADDANGMNPSSGASGLWAAGDSVVFDDIVWRKASAGEMTDVLRVQVGPSETRAWAMPHLPAPSEIPRQSVPSPDMVWIAVAGLLAAIMTVIVAIRWRR